MIEESILERILLNLGGDAPEILIILMLVKYVWPGLQDLFEQYLQGRNTAAATSAAAPFVPGVVTIVLDDSVGKVVDGLAQIIGAMGAASVGVSRDTTADVSPPPAKSGVGATSEGGAVRSSKSATDP